MGSRLNVYTLPRICCKAKAAILEGIDNPLAILCAGSAATGFYQFILFGSPQKSPLSYNSGLNFPSLT